ncbi:MAG TPA: chemotaxis protein CheW [Pseudomonadota bacterium]|nr:chemotaxis protein CheW [Pseudomonadota bacterium]
MSQPAGAVSQQRGANAQRNGTEMRAYTDMLTFHIGSEEYGLSIEHIREITKFKPITEVPRVPSFVSGIILVRGQVVPVLDLRMRLRLPGAGAGTRSRILVVSRPALETEASTEDEREPFGLIIDRVNHVVRINDADVEPPTVLAGHESEFVAGISRIKLAGEEVQKPALRYGPGLVAAEQYRIVILLDLLRVLTFEHGGSMRF